MKPDKYMEHANSLWSRMESINPEEVGSNSLAEYSPGSGEFRVRFIDRLFSIRPRERSIVYLDTQKEADVFTSIVLLHYLLNAKNLPLTGQVVSFKELWGGDIYFAAFSSRTIKPLVDIFSSEMDRFRDAGVALGGKVVEFGDCAVEVQAFPRIPVTLVIWQGDDEVPPSANILFDSSIKDQMQTEDVTVVCSLIVSRMKKQKQQ